MAEGRDETVVGAEADDILHADAASRSERDGVARARVAASGKLESAARRVRDLGDRAAERNRFLGPTRPLARNAAAGLDNAALYVKQRDLDEMREDLETQVRAHPLASVALAFLAGYAVRRIF
ncbi:MAG TPA: hypothetical protein VK966_08635 [Longimicrobiales bacterium]|nr:hypothetical protein [Longimicrobiales bacterium]